VYYDLNSDEWKRIPTWILVSPVTIGRGGKGLALRMAFMADSSKYRLPERFSKFTSVTAPLRKMVTSITASSTSPGDGEMNALLNAYYALIWSRIKGSWAFISPSPG
jgi:hypothetical protein